MLTDYLDGTVGSPLTMHLATVQVAPPWELTRLQEANFPGYQAANFTPNGQAAWVEGLGTCSGVAKFVNLELLLHHTIRQAWLTTVRPRGGSGDALMLVISNLNIDLPPGEWNLSFSFTSFKRQ